MRDDSKFSLCFDNKFHKGNYIVKYKTHLYDIIIF